MVKRKKICLILILFLFVGLSSCNKNNGYTSYQTLSKEGMTSTPYVFELSDLSFDNNPQNLFVRLRNDNSFAFANIFLICTLKAGDNLVLQDTLEFSMAAPDGTWLGTGFTQVKESKLRWKEGVVIPMGKPLLIEIGQAMRKSGTTNGISTLQGILSVGVSIEAED